MLNDTHTNSTRKRRLQCSIPRPKFHGIWVLGDSGVNDLHSLKVTVILDFQLQIMPSITEAMVMHTTAM